MQTSIKKTNLINACINPRYKTFDHSFSMLKQLLVAIFFFFGFEETLPLEKRTLWAQVSE